MYVHYMANVYTLSEIVISTPKSNYYTIQKSPLCTTITHKTHKKCLVKKEFTPRLCCLLALLYIMLN